MNTFADEVIKAFGGTTALGKLIQAPPSTVHSWRRIGIPSSRLAHIRLVAKDRGIIMPDEVETAEASQEAAE